MSRHLYTAEQLDFIRAAYARMTLADVARAFTAAFGIERTEKQMRAVTRNHRITCGRKGSQKLYPPARIMTPEQDRFIRETYRDITVEELHRRLNARFGTDFRLQQVKSYVHNHGINSGRTGHFPKGHQSWNAGTKGQGLTGRNRTSFRPGNMPANKRRLWSERVGKDGYIEMSVPERNPHTGFPTRYKHKHRWLWECEHGSVPAGHAVIFEDGDNRNFDLENLILVSRAELLALNLHGYKDAPAELKPTILQLARMEAKAGIRTRPARGRKGKEG